MALIVNVHEAKTQLSKLLRRVESGEDVLIGRAGEPVARLTRLSTDEPRPLGTWRGRVEMASDLDMPSDDVAEQFFKGSIEPDDG